MVLLAVLSPSFYFSLEGLFLSWSTQCTKARFYIFEYLCQRDSIKSIKLLPAQSEVSRIYRTSKAWCQKSRKSSSSPNWSLAPKISQRQGESLLKSNPGFLHPPIPSLSTYHVPGTVGVQRWIRQTLGLQNYFSTNFRMKCDRWPRGHNRKLGKTRSRCQILLYYPLKE